MNNLFLYIVFIFDKIFRAVMWERLALASEEHRLKMNGAGGLVVKALAWHARPGFDFQQDPKLMTSAK